MQYYNGRPASISVSSVNHKAVADSPVGWVLAGPLILQVKNPFYRKQVINKSTRLIFVLQYYNIADRRRILLGRNIISCLHMQKIFHAAQGILFCAKINKQSAKAICRFERLRTSHSKRQKAIQALKGYHLPTHLIIYCSGLILV